MPPVVKPSTGGTTKQGIVEPQTLSSEWDEANRCYKYEGSPTVKSFTTSKKLDVYRSVSLEEYQDILKNGFKTTPGLYEGKLFTYNYADAEHFSTIFENTIVVKARIPAGVPMEKVFGTDGLKFMYSVSGENLSKIKLVTYFINP